MLMHVRLLSELLEGKMYNEDETQRILRSFPQNPVAAQIAYKFVRNNWQVIVTRYFATSSALCPEVVSRLRCTTTVSLSLLLCALDSGDPVRL